MNRVDRLTAILIQLQSKSIVRAAEIADRFSISLRTVYRDIRALEDAGVPIGSQPGEGYYITDGYHLPPVMFTKEEAGALTLADKLVDCFSDPSVNQHYTSALYKIKSVLTDSAKSYLAQLDENIAVYAGKGHGQDDEKLGILSELQLLIGKSNMAEIVYRSGYKGEVTTRLIEPLGLCYWGGNWHLVAYCTLRNDYRDFRVSRVNGLVSTGMIFNRDRHDALTEILEKMNTPDALKTAIVRFESSLASMIAERKYYYGFVEERDVGDTVEMTFLVPSYTNFSLWLISFSDQVDIVSPTALKNAIVSQVKKLSEHYLDG